MTNEQLMKMAVEAYGRNNPVVVFSSDGVLCHGDENLKSIVDIKVGISCEKIDLDMTHAEWEATAALRYSKRPGRTG